MIGEFLRVCMFVSVVLSLFLKSDCGFGTGYAAICRIDHPRGNHCNQLELFFRADCKVKLFEFGPGNLVHHCHSNHQHRGFLRLYSPSHGFLERRTLVPDLS